LCSVFSLIALSLTAMDYEMSSDDEVTISDGERFYDSFADVRGTFVTIDRADDNDDNDRPFGISSDPGPSRLRSVFGGEMDRRPALEVHSSFRGPELSDFDQMARMDAVAGSLSLSQTRWIIPPFFKLRRRARLKTSQQTRAY